MKTSVGLQSVVQNQRSAYTSPDISVAAGRYRVEIKYRNKVTTDVHVAILDGGSIIHKEELDHDGTVYVEFTVPTATSTLQIELFHNGGISGAGSLDISLADVTLEQINYSMTVQSTADYYPFGMKFPNSVSSSFGERHDYQGDFSEKDEETGWNAFELRMYDSRIGRWLSVDPMGQYHSPYLSMGNNPISRVDPDGGYDGNPSTEVTDNGDGTYTVQDVKNDNDLNVYVVDADGNRTGEVIGQTRDWDEFVNHDAMGNPTTPMEGATLYNQTIDNWLDYYNGLVVAKVEEVGNIDAGNWLARESGNGKTFDVKTKLGASNGYLFQGKWTTGRSFGNYLAGYNGETVRPWYIGHDTFWTVLIGRAGKLHMEANHLNKAPHGSKWSGEIDYAGRMIRRGYVNSHFD